MAQKRPSLVVIAGPNGSGKSTFVEQLRQHAWLEGVRYINADEIARDEFGDWNSPDAVLNAARRADERREACLANRDDFAFETVFSTQAKVEFLARAAAAGYFIRLFFIATEDPGINIRRVALRVREHGHNVPSGRIVSRYHRSIRNLAAGLKLADRGYVYDNSAEGAEPRLLLRSADGKVVRFYAGDAPVWVQDAIAALTENRPPEDGEDRI